MWNDGSGAAFPRYVCIAMEALDQLLMACHCQSINLFVESFLKMVAKLLESEKPNLQILGTNSVRSCPGALVVGVGVQGGWGYRASGGTERVGVQGGSGYRASGGIG